MHLFKRFKLVKREGIHKPRNIILTRKQRFKLLLKLYDIELLASILNVISKLINFKPLNVTIVTQN